MTRTVADANTSDNARSGWFNDEFGNGFVVPIYFLYAGYGASAHGVVPHAPVIWIDRDNLFHEAHLSLVLLAMCLILRALPVGPIASGYGGSARPAMEQGSRGVALLVQGFCEWLHRGIEQV